MSYHEINKWGKEKSGKLRQQYGFPHAILQSGIHQIARCCLWLGYQAPTSLSY